MTLPNLVIAGAPKCGTSSLFKWLADHTEVCGASVKETFYLMDEGHPLLRKNSNFHRHGLEGYRAHFNNGSKKCRIHFEATTHYLYQRTALEVLSGLPEPPQIVFVLRKPSERVYSSFQYSKNNLANVRSDLSFSSFVDEIRRDPDSQLIDEYAGESAYVLRNDIRYSRYIEYLSAWVARFGSERVHVLLLEEMKRAPRAFMQDLARRVRIDPAFYDSYDFPVMNETVNIKHPSLHRRVRKLNGLVPRWPLKGLMKSIYLKSQSAQTVNEKTPEDRRALTELEQEFRPYNQRLAEGLGLDLSAWN
ncbi:MAG TPA: sulfotransferase domain-containing protein [Pyrinomonadaceae bacterium]|nr:sulfotransferase domain-containing protein [Pyrinomonadaceae bacterium]